MRVNVNEMALINEVELYRAVGGVLVAMVVALGTVLGKRARPRADPASGRRADFQSMQDAAADMLDRKDKEIERLDQAREIEVRRCREELESVSSERDVLARENHRLREVVQVLEMESSLRKRPSREVEELP